MGLAKIRRFFLSGWLSRGLCLRSSLRLFRLLSLKTMRRTLMGILHMGRALPMMMTTPPPLEVYIRRLIRLHLWRRLVLAGLRRANGRLGLLHSACARGHARPGPAFQFLLCVVVLAGSTTLTAAVQVRPSAPVAPAVGTWRPKVCDSGALAAVPGRPRPLPAPCRARQPLYVSLSAEDSDSDAEDAGVGTELFGSSAVASSLQFGGAQATVFRTLLCLAARDPCCPGFAVAAATLEVLFEEFPGLVRTHTCSDPMPCPARTLTLHDKVAPPPGVPGNPIWAQDSVPRLHGAAHPSQIGGTVLPFSLGQLAAVFAPGAAIVGLEQASIFCPELGSHDWPAVIQELVLARSQCSPSTIVCFTDGSFTDRGEAGSLCGWACVFFQPDTRKVCFLYGAFPAFLAEAGFCASPFQGEVAGLLAAALAAMAVFPDRAMHFLSDCTSALGIAQGVCAYSPGTVGQAMRHAHWFRSILVRQRDAYSHVRGHQGHIGNELADLLAKTASRCSAASCGLRAPSDLLQRWLCAGAPYLPWAGAVLASSAGDWTLPPADHTALGDDTHHAGLSVEQLLEPFLPANSFDALDREPESLPSCSDADGRVLCLTVATFNTLSLGPSSETDDGSMKTVEGLAYRPGRAPLLAAQLEAHAIQAICLQENRAEEGFTKVGGFLRYASGAIKGQWGTEWWFRDQHSLFKGTGPLGSITFSEQRFAVVHIRFACAPLQVLFIGVHAPHRATEACALEEWRRQTVRLVRLHSRTEFVIFAGDCNAALGSVPTAHVSSLGAEDEDTAGEYVHSILRFLDNCVPSTFSECHRGATHTYTRKRGGQPTRIDYVCVPRAWLSGHCTSSPAPGLHAAHSCPDHVAAVVAARFPKQVRAARRDLHKRAFRVSDITAEENAPVIERALTLLPPIPWGVSAHAHAAILVSSVQRTLASLRQKKATAPHRSYLQPATWRLQQQVAAARRSLHRLQHRVRGQSLAVCFDAWCGRRQDSALTQDCLWWRQADVAVAAHQAVLRKWCLQLRKACREDRAAHLGRLADQVSSGPSSEVFRSLHALLGHRRKKPYCADPLPALKLADGTLCSDGGQILARWRQHFGALEAGKQLDMPSLVMEVASDIHHSQSVAQAWPQPDSILDLPTEADIQRLLGHR